MGSEMCIRDRDQRLQSLKRYLPKQDGEGLGKSYVLMRYRYDKSSRKWSWKADRVGIIKERGLAPPTNYQLIHHWSELEESAQRGLRQQAHEPDPRSISKVLGKSVNICISEQRVPPRSRVFPAEKKRAVSDVRIW